MFIFFKLFDLATVTEMFVVGMGSGWGRVELEKEFVFGYSQGDYCD